MTSVVTPGLAGDFDNFYEAHFGDTVAMAYGFTADLGAAQDIAQEAFCRAWLRWRELSTYDNPVAWVRRVATNLAHSRWRRLRVAATHLVRQRDPEPVPAVNPDHVAVVAALRKLPAAQRRAVVLHHLMDLPVTEVAEQLEVPVGTVKSWLHRARAALADDLRVDVRGAVATPPAEEVVGRAVKRRRAQVISAASAMVLVILGGLVAMRLVRFDGTPPPVLNSPTPAVSPSPDPMSTVAWPTATIAFDVERGAACPKGPITFAPESGVATGPSGNAWPKAVFNPSRVAVGDLTGDGRAEAALIVTCLLDENSDDQMPYVLVVERRDTGLHALGWTGRPSSRVANLWISDGLLFADSRPHEPSKSWTYVFGRVDAWRWEDAQFSRVDTSARYPAVTRLEVSAVADQLGCAKVPVATISPHLGNRAGVTYEWGGGSDQPVFAELGRTGQPYMVLLIDCARRASIVVFDLTDGQWRAITALSLGSTVKGIVMDPSAHGLAVYNAVNVEGRPVEYRLVDGKLVSAGPPSPTASPSGAAQQPKTKQP